MTHQVEGSSQDGGIRYCARLAAVEQELKTLHALADGAQVDHVLVLHGLLAGSQPLLEAMRSWRERWIQGDTKTKQKKKKKHERKRKQSR